MVHPARSSNSRAQWPKSSSKISQKWSIQHAWPATVLDGPESRPEPPETRRLPLGERLMVLRGSETREENGRIGAKRQDVTAANAGTAATKTGTSSSNRPNNQVPQTCSSNIENRMNAFSPNARPSGLLPRKNLSSESQTEDRHLHASHRQGRISLAHVAPPSAQWPAAPTSTSRAAQPSPAVDCRTPSKTPCSAQAWWLRRNAVKTDMHHQGAGPRAFPGPAPFGLIYPRATRWSM